MLLTLNKILAVLSLVKAEGEPPFRSKHGQMHWWAWSGLGRQLLSRLRDSTARSPRSCRRTREPARRTERSTPP